MSLANLSYYVPPPTVYTKKMIQILPLILILS